MSEDLDFVTLWISWSPVAYNRGCTLVIDGRAYALDSRLRTLKSVERGRHRFLFGDPVDGISESRTLDLRTDVSVALGVEDAAPRPRLRFEVDERKPDVVPQEYDIHGNLVGRRLPLSQIVVRGYSSVCTFRVTPIFFESISEA